MKKYQLQPQTGGEVVDVADTMVMGRDDGCDLVLPLDQASRKHAQLIPDDDTLWIEDLKSTNGTFVNEQRIQGKQPLNDGDTVRIDTAQYRVVISDPDNDADADPDATVMQSPPADDATVLSSRPAAKAPPKQEAAPDQESGHNPPPSWTMEDNQDISGTQILGASPISQTPADLDRPPVTEVATPTLVGLSEPVKGQHFQMPPKSESNKWEIGRDPGCDISIDTGSVSQSHAQLINEGNRWKLVDLMSANGTFVNGRKGLTSYLSSGDVVRFGTVEMQFLLDQEETLRAQANTRQASNKKGLVMGLIAFGITVAALSVAALFLL